MIFCVVQVRAYEFGFYIPVQWVGGVKHMDRTAMIASLDRFGNVHLKDGTIFKNPEYEYSANLHFCTLTENSADVVCLFLFLGLSCYEHPHTMLFEEWWRDAHQPGTHRTQDVHIERQCCTDGTSWMCMRISPCGSTCKNMYPVGWFNQVFSLYLPNA